MKSEMKSDDTALRFIALFGGMTNPTEIFDNLGNLFYNDHAYLPISFDPIHSSWDSDHSGFKTWSLQRFVSHAADTLTVCAYTATHSHALTYFSEGTDIVSWLLKYRPSAALPISVPVVTAGAAPSNAYISSPAIAFPLLILSQLTQLLFTLHTLRLTPLTFVQRSSRRRV